MITQRCIDDLLMRGADDWVDATEVAWVAKSIGGAVTPEDIRDLSLQLIRELVRQGLMEVGDVLEKGGFRKWDLSAEEALDRVEREWKALGRNPEMGEVCWLCSTEEGDARGEDLLRKRESVE